MTCPRHFPVEHKLYEAFQADLIGFAPCLKTMDELIEILERDNLERQERHNRAEWSTGRGVFVSDAWDIFLPVRSCGASGPTNPCIWRPCTTSLYWIPNLGPQSKFLIPKQVIRLPIGFGATTANRNSRATVHPAVLSPSTLFLLLYHHTGPSPSRR